jgi:hypothetical protein
VVSYTEAAIRKQAAAASDAAVRTWFHRVQRTR